MSLSSHSPAGSSSLPSFVLFIHSPHSVPRNRLSFVEISPSQVKWPTEQTKDDPRQWKTVRGCRKEARWRMNDRPLHALFFHVFAGHSPSRTSHVMRDEWSGEGSAHSIPTASKSMMWTGVLSDGRNETRAVTERRRKQGGRLRPDHRAVETVGLWIGDLRPWKWIRNYYIYISLK